MGYATLSQTMVATANIVYFFAKCTQSVPRLGVLVERPFTNFKKAGEILGDHFHGKGEGAHSKGRQSHQAAVEAAMSFLAVMENKAL